MRAEFRKGGKPVRAQAGPEEELPESPSPEAAPSPHETQLLRILLASDEHVGAVAGTLDPEWLTHLRVRRIVEQRLRLHAAGQWPGPAAFLTLFEDDLESQALIGRCFAEERPIPNPEKQLMDILIGLRNQALTRQSNDLLRQLGNPELDMALRIELTRRKEELRVLKSQPLQPRLSLRSE